MSVSSLFTGKTILLTGATGLLGKATVEKVLRDLPEVCRLCLLLRAPGSDPDAAWARAETSLFQSSLFDRLRQQHGAEFAEFYRSKIDCFAGDIRLPNLGLDEALAARLAAQVDIVIHCAASVTFDEPLDSALATNVDGAAHVLEFARRAGAVLVHVSTAYVSGPREGAIPEVIETPTFDLAEELATLRERVASVRAASLPPLQQRRELVRLGMEHAQRRGWFDAYTFTKFLGEQWLLAHRGDVPVAIVRPSIIESCLREPEPGWIEGLRMADPLLIAAGRGLKQFPLNLDAVLDLIPLDYVVNATLAACCHAGSHPPALHLFTIATWSEHPLVQRKLVAHVRAFYERHPLHAGVPLPAWRYPSLAQFTRMSAWKLRLLGIAQTVLQPLAFVSLIRPLARRVRRALFELRQSKSFLESYGAYLQFDGRFQTANTRALHEQLSDKDRERFGFDVQQIDWSHYLQAVHLPGLLRHALRIATPEA